ncbi:hypothetical protein BDR26DRAFT_860494 [Obelidium mucronatum]|nr:hypothetical protein BDR26DRAFT_860494 [Obelidium mucronatum]
MAYDLGSAQALQWFSIQSLSSQARTLATLCISSYQLSQIQADLNIYLQYLNETSRLTIRAKNTADDCLSSYTLITPKSAAESICSMKTVIWFASQQDPIKLQVADALCANAPKDIVGTYQNMSCINKYLGFSPRFRIVTCPAFAPINQRQITNVYIYMCLGAVSILFLLLVVWFIGNFESRKTRSTETKGSIWATPFNASLLISITCLIWQDALYSVYWGLSVMKMFPSESVINYYLGSQIFGVFWRLSYIFLCFKRSELQISRVFDQLWLQVIKGILVSTPVVQLTPVIANIVEIYYLDKSSFAGTYICQLISASSLLVLDCLFLYAFAKFLLEAKTGNLNQMELNFGIIARYGIVTCLFCFVISVSMMGKVVTIYVNPYNSSLLNIWSLSGSFAMHFVTACQIAMKIHVFLVKKSAGNPGSSGGTAGNGSLRDLMKSSNSAK